MKLLTIFFFTAALYTCTNSVIAQKHPNFVILFADDLGYSDLGCYGGEIKTPNLDKLAQQGLLFTQFMNCSKCAASRAALLTGLYPLETGCNGEPAQMINGLTFAELLKGAGYHTLMTGKWHAKESPTKRGFQRYYGCIKGGSNFFEPTKAQPFFEDNNRINPITTENKNTFYTTDEYTNRAIDFLETSKKDAKPFLLYVAYNAPHFPLQAWPEDIAKYRGKYMKGWDEIRKQRFERQKKLGIVNADWKLSVRDKGVEPWASFKRKDDADRTMATYAAMVDRMDQNIGRLLAKLEDIGAAENTLVIFLSDNGGNAEGNMWDGKDPRTKPDTRNSQAKLGDEWANACNTPYKKFKRYMYNGGQLTPCIVRWPKGMQQRGSITRQPAHIIDLAPTFYQLAGVKYPQGETFQLPAEHGLKNEWNIQPLSGKSILPILQGHQAPKRTYFYGHFQAGRMIMKDHWKLVSDGSDGTVQHLYDYPWELYDMNNDATEQENLASQHPTMVAKMDADYRAWIARADSLTGITQHKWFQPRFSNAQQQAADELEQDPTMQAFLSDRKTIGLKIVAELNAQNINIKRGLGMEKVPMSYFGLVKAGRAFSSKTMKLRQLYAAWDQNIKLAEEYCNNKGSIYAETWHIQERIRPNIPAYDLE